MFDMIASPSSIWDDMFRMTDALLQYPFKDNKSLENNGLKRLISRPHNIVNVKDNDGKVIAQRLEVVTTPFKKEDVKVTVDNDTLTIQCGSENKEQKVEDEYVYKGISAQSYTFSLKMGNNVDKSAIKAKNTDGVLTITLPFVQKKEEPKQITNIEVE